jgi:preprotein translocase subunit SecY
LEYNVIYFLAIVIFGVFYAFIALKPDSVAENLQKSGGFIPGIRPGESTEKYIGKVLLRLTTVGSLVLAFLAMIPLLAGNFLSSITDGQQFTIFTGIGGTSILIIVGVILETARQIESLKASQDYERFV